MQGAGCRTAGLQDCRVQDLFGVKFLVRGNQFVPPLHLIDFLKVDQETFLVLKHPGTLL